MPERERVKGEGVTMKIEMNTIGTVRAGRSYAVEIEKEYAAGISGLAGFSHVMILWYAHKKPEWDPAQLVIDKPYRLAPDRLGIFATRSPIRPNGICASVAAVSSIDVKKGIIKVWWTDAEDGSPVLDVKPYYHCSEYVRDAKYPDWCAHWPACYEDSANFAWDREFLF